MIFTGAAPALSLALVLSEAVGDGTMMMALAHNLARNGHAPKVFGRIARELAAWFPWCDIAPDDAGAETPTFDTVVELYPSSFGARLSRSGESIAIASLPGYLASGTLTLDRILVTGGRHFGLIDVIRGNGITFPGGFERLQAPRRVVIHPTASHPEKSWHGAKFLALARALAGEGFEPGFIVPPDRLASWRDAGDGIATVHAFSTLGGVAGWIAEAGWFIGNDSGPGHLASSLGVPTLSLFMRSGLARTWRPGWAPGRVVLPPRVLPGSRLRELFWQRTLSVRRVLREFGALRAEVRLPS